MPRLPTFQTQSRVQGTSVNIGSPDNGVLGAAMGAALTVGRTVQDLRAAQERERQRLEHNEALTYSVNTGSEAEIEWRERLQKEQDGGSTDGMTARLVKDFEGYTQRKIEQAPSAARDLVTRELSNAKAKLHAQSFLIETKARDQKVINDFEIGLDADRRSTFADPQQFQPILARRLALASVLQLPEQAKQKLAQEAREGLALEAAASMVERDPDAFLKRAGMSGAKTGKDGKPIPTDAAAAAENVKNDPVLSNLAPAAMRQMVDRATLLKVQREQASAADLEIRQRQAELAAAKREREANQAYTILSDWAREGIAADPIAAKPLLAKIAGTPYQAAYQVLAAKVATNAAAATLPLEAQRAELNRLYAQRAAGGTSPAMQHEISQRESILSAAQRDYNNDPMTGGAKRGLVTLTPIDMDQPYDSILQQVGARVPGAQRMSMVTGGAVSPFTEDEAAQLKKSLDAMPPQQKSIAIAKMGAIIGFQQAQGLATQIDKHDRGLALAFKAGNSMTSTSRLSSELILAGQQAQKDSTSTKGLKTPEITVSNWKSEISRRIGDAYGSQGTTNDVRDAAVFIAHAFSAQQSGGVGEDDLDRAVRIAVGGQIVEHNGRKLPLPMGVDSEMLQGWLRNIPREAMAQQAPGGKVVAGGVGIPVDEFLDALPGQQLVPVRPGQYAVLVNGRPVLNTKGEKILIKVQ